MQLHEMQGLLAGKCLPGDIKTNESLAEWFMRKFAERDALVAENAILKGNLTGNKYIEWVKENGWNPQPLTINGKFVKFIDPEIDFGSMVFNFAHKSISSVRTPDTDAFIAQKEADGVRKFAECAHTLEEHDHAIAFADSLVRGK